MSTRVQCMLVLIALMVVDISPVPVTAILGLYIVAVRPRWFKKKVDSLYGD